MVKKILHIQVVPLLSGAQKVSLAIMKNLPQDYEKYVLFSSNGDGATSKEECISLFSQAGCKVLFSNCLQRDISLVKDLKALLEIYKLCKKERFDIVHTHSTKPGVIGRIAATLAKVPFVIHTVHGLAFYKILKFPRWHLYWTIEMFSSLFCNKIILVNQYYSKYFKWCKHKVLTIYNGIDFDQETPLLASSYCKVKERVNILSVGRLDIQKNPICILQAAKIVCEKYNHVFFTIVGNGKLYNDCSNYIKQNALLEKVQLVGWQDKPNSYYNKADIFVGASIYEAFGLVYVEAGCYGLPVVTTNVEGTPEVVLDGVTGLLYEPNTPEMLAKKLVMLIENSSLRRNMGDAGKKWCSENFSSSKMVKAYFEVYENHN